MAQLACHTSVKTAVDRANSVARAMALRALGLSVALEASACSGVLPMWKLNQTLLFPSITTCLMASSSSVSATSAPVLVDASTQTDDASGQSVRVPDTRGPFSCMTYDFLNRF